MTMMRLSIDGCRKALVNAAANELDEEMLSDVLTAASSDEEMRERSPKPLNPKAYKP